MRLIKYTHACVRLERDGRSLVIDPGVWTEPEALLGADAVLVTHEHGDHVDGEMLEAAIKGNPALQIWTNADVANQLPQLGPAVTAVATGDVFEAAGFTVQACGGRHAFTFERLPDAANLGYVVDGVYHPGDAYFVSDLAVETLLVPTSGPWTKVGDGIEFVRAVAPRRAYSIHDAVLNERGLGLVDGWLGEYGYTDYARLEIGEAAEL
jgi:L-ascorbate metabolism protein UlaG (beta-lactamase superfamily)